jgi:hypothetical protein
VVSVLQEQSGWYLQESAAVVSVLQEQGHWYLQESAAVVSVLQEQGWPYLVSHSLPDHVYYVFFGCVRAFGEKKIGIHVFFGCVRA